VLVTISTVAFTDGGWKTAVPYVLCTCWGFPKSSSLLADCPPVITVLYIHHIRTVLPKLVTVQTDYPSLLSIHRPIHRDVHGTWCHSRLTLFFNTHRRERHVHREGHRYAFRASRVGQRARVGRHDKTWKVHRERSRGGEGRGCREGYGERYVCQAFPNQEPPRFPIVRP
jgi:hypothetical protein